ncbi:uncharacterized protein LOC131648911 [Vicia villosa]|uniref:uncharacterized protein LOC131648911 n=1 Tax=Vicia villosa TaxID=3911 RepID=UPI00273AA65F|nr:uncharacterized protein LOC131648911 [Vicia villosa]
MGFIGDDREFISAIEEAYHWGSRHYLRLLFVHMLLSSSITRPRHVWSKTQHLLSDGIVYSQQIIANNRGSNNFEIMNLTLIEIEKLLQRNRKSLSDIPGMPKPQGFILEELGNKLIYEDRSYSQAEQLQEFNMLYKKLTGIASLLLPGGRTTHSKFKIPIPTLESSTCDISKGSDCGDLLKLSKLIIWDEAPMAHRFCFEALDKTLKDIMGGSKSSDKIFGGKSGNKINPSELEEFLKWILKLEDGKLAEPNDGYAEIDIPPELLISDFADPLEAIFQNTYPNFSLNYNNEEFLQSRAILARTIETVDQINQYVFELLPGEQKEYLSSDYVDTSDGDDNECFNVLTPEFLNTLKCSGLPNHNITLKIGTPIMLLRNIDQSEGLCNGTRLIVTRLADHVIEAKIISGKNIGGVVYIARMDITPTQSPWPFKMTRRQFPITVCYAMTINKSQGQSLDYVGIYLPRSVFSHDQLYVAVSRVKSKKRLKILIHDKDNKPLSTTTNVIFKEVFENL